jgi:D-lactate dehydrogenase
MAVAEPPSASAGLPAASPAPDRAPDALAPGTPEGLRTDLVALLGADRVLHRALDLVRYASDASPYRRFPKVVALPRDAHDVARLLEYGRRTGTPLTLRAAGTSLNGQAQGDGILVDLRRHWAGVRVEDGGARARVRPGTVLGHVNRALARHGRKLGPDPASSDFATVGGVVANNSGGMRCGIERDSYRTVRALSFVLPSGTIVDSDAPGAEERFAAEEPALAQGLTEIRDEIRADDELAARIRRKFAIKNTTGYRLCAFLDADTPLEIFRRLLVGSEGTLAVLTEVVFETVPWPLHSSTAMLIFESIDAAAAAVPALVARGSTATELMVATTLLVAAHNSPGTPERWKALPSEAAAVLCEFRSDDPAQLDGREAAALELLADHELLDPPAFTRELEATETFWRVREGMHGLVGMLRPQEAALIPEDVCVPPERVAEAAKDLQALLAEHGFLPGVAGHASAGNLHFMLTPEFAKPEDRERYDRFMHALAELIVARYDGSLKAEHGTGVNMAPFVEREWGADATALMWRIKALADPDDVLAPGVVLNRDPQAHLRDLKSNPAIEAVATQCVECGFCEPVCPSRDLTTTPRQRIVVRREIARQAPGSPVARALEEQFAYDGIDTCAADGSCRLACPVGIDTGKLIKGLRGDRQPEGARRAALSAARRWGGAERRARAGLRAAHALRGVTGDAPLYAGLGAARRLAGAELVPAWSSAMPRAAPGRLPSTERQGAAAVYLPACVNRIFGASATDPDAGWVVEALVEVSRRGGLPVWIPPDAAGHCCATPWSSKGYEDGARWMANHTVAALWRWSDEGRLPVVLDASSCSLGLLEEVGGLLDEDNRARHERLEILDAIRWTHERLLPRLEIPRRVSAVTVHPPCSVRPLGLGGELEAIAGALADAVEIPVTATCCGFAGDRGLLHPELTAAATAPEAAELEGRHFDARLCSNRTCEIGLEQATGEPYTSFLLPLERLTRP